MMSRKHYPMKSDVREKKDAYLLEIDLPGCHKEDIKAYVEDGYLYVAATMNKEKSKSGGKFIRKESYWGDYKRSFFVGNNITQDMLKATFKHGVLRITVPKAEEKLPEDNTILIEG